MKINHRDRKDNYKMTPKLEKLLERVGKDIKNNRNLVGPFSTAKEANEYLDPL